MIAKAAGRAKIRLRRQRSPLNQAKIRSLSGQPLSAGDRRFGLMAVAIGRSAPSSRRYGARDEANETIGKHFRRSCCDVFGTWRRDWRQTRIVG
jgi:hypothetical protein